MDSKTLNDRRREYSIVLQPYRRRKHPTPVDQRHRRSYLLRTLHALGRYIGCLWHRKLCLRLLRRTDGCGHGITLRRRWTVLHCTALRLVQCRCDPSTGRFLTRNAKPNQINPYLPFDPTGDARSAGGVGFVKHKA